MRYLRVSELVSIRMVSRESCKDQMLFIFSQLLFRKLKCQYTYQFLLFYSAFYMAFRKWSQCNKVRQNYFSEGFSAETVPEYSPIFISIHFLLHENLVKFKAMARVACWLPDDVLSHYVKFVPNSSWQSAVFLGYI